MIINISVAKKVLETVDAGLSSGLGEPIPGQMCVEAAVCYALGLEHSDDPKCVSYAVRKLKIRLNDSRWSTKEARAKGMRRLALAQLGSAGILDDAEFSRRCVRLAIQTSVPEALRAAASICKEKGKKEAMLVAAADCEANPTRDNAIKARTAADAAAAYSAAAAAAAAADADAAWSAYFAYAYSAASASAESASAGFTSAAAARNKSLAKFAEGVVQILIDMKAPGCQWLHLTEK